MPAVSDISSETAEPIATKLSQKVPSFSATKILSLFFSVARPIWPLLLKIAKTGTVFSVTSGPIWMKSHRYVEHISLYKI